MRPINVGRGVYSGVGSNPCPFPGVTTRCGVEMWRTAGGLLPLQIDRALNNSAPINEYHRQYIHPGNLADFGRCN